jgi:hypothetical protein
MSTQFSCQGTICRWDYCLRGVRGKGCRLTGGLSGNKKHLALRTVRVNIATLGVERVVLAARSGEGDGPSDLRKCPLVATRRSRVLLALSRSHGHGGRCRVPLPDCRNGFSDFSPNGYCAALFALLAISASKVVLDVTPPFHSHNLTRSATLSV